MPARLVALTEPNASDPIGQHDEEAGSVTGTRVTLRGLRVTDTSFVAPRNAAPFYEIQMTTPIGTTYTFVTRDERLYREALSFEGVEHRVVVSYHSTPRTGSRQHVQVLDQWSADDGGVTEAFATGARVTGVR